MTDNLEVIAPVVHGEPEVPEVQPQPQPDPVVEGLTQRKLQQVIDTAAARAAHAAKADLERANTENKRLKEQLAGSAPDADLLEKTRSELALERTRADHAAAQTAELEKRAHLNSLANQFGVLPQAEADVARLVKDSIRFDPESKQWIAVNDAGLPITKADGSVTTAAEHYNAFTQQRLWVLASTVKSGTGSTGSTGSILAPARYDIRTLFGPNSDAAACNRLSISDPVTYKRLRAEAVRAGLVAGAR